MPDDDFPHELVDFNRDHSDIIFQIFNRNLRLSQNVFLDIGLFIQDAEFIISVNQLNACVISVLASFFVLEPEVLHVLLKRKDDNVEFLNFIDVLVNELLLFFLFQFVLVEFGFGLVSFVDFELLDVVVVLDVFVFL